MNSHCCANILSVDILPQESRRVLDFLYMFGFFSFFKISSLSSKYQHICDRKVVEGSLNCTPHSDNQLLLTFIWVLPPDPHIHGLTQWLFSMSYILIPYSTISSLLKSVVSCAFDFFKDEDPKITTLTNFSTLIILCKNVLLFFFYSDGLQSLLFCDHCHNIAGSSVVLSFALSLQLFTQIYNIPSQPSLLQAEPVPSH